MLAATLLTSALLVAVPDKDAPAPASTSWVGKTVIVVNTAVNIGQLDEQTKQIVPPVTPLMGLDYRVYGERGNFVQVKTREAVMGWTDKRNVRLVDDAVAFFTKSLEMNPDDITGLNHRGWAWAMKGEYMAGIADMTRAIELSGDPVFYNNRARIWGLKGDLDKALKDYAVAIEGGGGHYLHYGNRAKVWHLKKDYDKAIADFDMSVQMNANYAAAYHHRGLAWHAKKDYDRAIADLTQGLRIDPKMAQGMADRAVTWISKGELGKARTDLDDAVKADPTCESALCLRGRMLTKEKEYPKALADLDEAIRLNGRYVQAVQYRGELRARLKQYDKAAADFERAIWLDDGKTAEPIAALAFFQSTCPEAKWRDGKRALNLAQQAVKLDKSDGYILESLAAAHAEVGNFDEAIRIQQQALGALLESADAARTRLELYRKKQPYRHD